MHPAISAFLADLASIGVSPTMTVLLGLDFKLFSASFIGMPDSLGKLIDSLPITVLNKLFQPK